MTNAPWPIPAGVSCKAQPTLTASCPPYEIRLKDQSSPRVTLPRCGRVWRRETSGWISSRRAISRMCICFPDRTRAGPNRRSAEGKSPGPRARALLLWASVGILAEQEPLEIRRGDQATPSDLEAFQVAAGHRVADGIEGHVEFCRSFVELVWSAPRLLRFSRRLGCSTLTPPPKSGELPLFKRRKADDQG